MPVPKKPLEKRPEHIQLFGELPKCRSAVRGAVPRRRRRLWEHERPVQMPVFEKQYMDKIEASVLRMISAKALYNTTKIGGKTVNVKKESIALLAGIGRVPGVNTDALEKIMIDGAKEGLFTGRTKTEIFGMLMNGIGVKGGHISAIRFAPRTPQQDEAIRNALDRLAFFAKQAVIARLAQKDHARTGGPTVPKFR